MRSASYAVVKYVADPARDEPMNVGVVAWDADRVLLRIDEAATQRVVRANPHLDREALADLEEFLREGVLRDWPTDPAGVEALLGAASSGPVVVTAPRFTSIDDSVQGGMERTVDRLVARLVHPRPRPADAPREPGGVGYFRARFNRLIQAHVVTKDYPFRTSKSGVLRSVDFFANSGANAVLDVLPLGLSRERAFQERVDAQAGKIYDIMQVNDLRRFVVYCQMRQEDEAGEAGERARRIIESVGANATTSREEAAEAFVQQLDRPL